VTLLLDSSAIVAIILQEPGWEILKDLLNAADLIAINSATLLEAHMVLTNRMGKDALPTLEAFLAEAEIQVLPFTNAHWRMAAEGFLRYGKGRHPAALNFGDCIVYATARMTQLPLLFKGGDFELTDVLRVS
jgi:ribonuclease VapC